MRSINAHTLAWPYECVCIELYVCVSAQTQVGVSCVCVFFKDNWGSFLSDQSVLVALCSLKMFVLLAKHRPINSA